MEKIKHDADLFRAIHFTDHTDALLHRLRIISAMRVDGDFNAMRFGEICDLIE